MDNTAKERKYDTELPGGSVGTYEEFLEWDRD